MVNVAASGALTLQDCRQVFAPLTEIDRGGDLKKHNRHLHGWGVVCGLKVHCTERRSEVGVAPGYALACNGSDIDVDEPQRVPVVERAKALQLLDDNGDAELVITLAPRPGGRFAMSAPTWKPAAAC